MVHVEDTIIDVKRRRKICICDSFNLKKEKEKEKRDCPLGTKDFIADVAREPELRENEKRVNS